MSEVFLFPIRPKADTDFSPANTLANVLIQISNQYAHLWETFHRFHSRSGWETSHFA